MMLDGLDGRDSIQMMMNNPRVVQCLVGSHASSWVSLQETNYKILGGVAYISPFIGWKVVDSSLYRIVNFFIVGSIEWWITTKKDISDDTTTPKVTGFVILFVQDCVNKVI